LLKASGRYTVDGKQDKVWLEKVKRKTDSMAKNVLEELRPKKKVIKYRLRQQSPAPSGPESDLEPSD
jgi:hypothetical protein